MLSFISPLTRVKACILCFEQGLSQSAGQNMFWSGNNVHGMGRLVEESRCGYDWQWLV